MNDETLKPVDVVHLLQATRLPANHQKLLRARVEGLPSSELALFEPDYELRKEYRLNMAEAIVQPDRSNTVTLILENASCEPLRLRKGRVIGMMQPVHLGSPRGTDEADGSIERLERPVEPEGLQ